MRLFHPALAALGTSGSASSLRRRRPGEHWCGYARAASGAGPPDGLAGGARPVVPCNFRETARCLALRAVRCWHGSELRLSPVMPGGRRSSRSASALRLRRGLGTFTHRCGARASSTFHHCAPVSACRRQSDPRRAFSSFSEWMTTICLDDLSGRVRSRRRWRSLSRRRCVRWLRRWRRRRRPRVRGRGRSRPGIT